ncbi:hypothetical protein LCGC14_0627820 [marine sediment metagenome]|uniref:HTH hxlR-type domain-containing protein n=1 Tax=marine sediment metagenome TaxID=412755 RepID=A0A0F9RMA1_9ZZZZ
MRFKKALEVIRDNLIHSPKQFALLMWPDSDGWKRIHKCGNGVSRGAMMPMVGGGLLGKLKAAGLIRAPWYDDYESYYQLTDKGQQTLKMTA